MKPTVEQLDARIVPATHLFSRVGYGSGSTRGGPPRVTAELLDDGTVKVTGTNRKDRVTATLGADGLLTVTAATAARRNRFGETQTWEFVGVTQVNMSLGNGNDDVTLVSLAGLPLSIDGGGGRDLVRLVWPQPDVTEP